MVAVSASVTIAVTASVTVTEFECLDHCCEFVKSESRDQKAETVKNVRDLRLHVSLLIFCSTRTYLPTHEGHCYADVVPFHCRWDDDPHGQRQEGVHLGIVRDEVS